MTNDTKKLGSKDISPRGPYSRAKVKHITKNWTRRNKANEAKSEARYRHRFLDKWAEHEVFNSPARAVSTLQKEDRRLGL